MRKSVWLLLSCLATFQVISESKVCAPGYSRVTYGTSSSCFKMQVPTTKNKFSEAKQACIAEGASLISAPTMLKFTAITLWLKEDVKPSLDIWVDVTYSGSKEGPFDTSSDYVWANGQPVQTEMWATGEPSAKTTTPGHPTAAVIWRSRGRGYKLDNRSPYKLASYVCEKPLELKCEQFGCWSNGGSYNLCDQAITKGPTEDYSVEVTRQHTSAACTEGVSYGISEDRKSVWVDKGCKATFKLCSDAACSKDEWHCADLSACIPLSGRCDGMIQCQDLSDEVNCDSKKNTLVDAAELSVIERLFIRTLSRKRSGEGRIKERKTTGCEAGDELGQFYTGTVSTTNSGRTCQAWVQQSPHVYFIDNPDYWKDLEETLEEASNYCRNPDHAPGGPWCLTTDPDKRWEYCDIPGCGDNKNVDTCEDGYTFVKYDNGLGSCYKIQNPINKIPYDQALGACTSEGASLVSATTLYEFDAVREWLKHEYLPRKTDFWVGLEYKLGSSWGKGKNYEWIENGESAMNSMWAKDEPSETMTQFGEPTNVVMWGSRGYQLDNRSPRRLASYLCEKPQYCLAVNCAECSAGSSTVCEKCEPAYDVDMDGSCVLSATRRPNA